MNASTRSLLFALLIALPLTLVRAPAAVAQSGGVPANVAVSVANFRAGPGTNFPIIGAARSGAVLTLNGRNTADTWYQACCINNRTGWIARSVIRTQGSTAALPIVSEGRAQPAPAPDWRGEYFSTRDLQGAPTLVRFDPTIDFRWGGSSPAQGLPTINFSVRWTRQATFEAGDYQFYAQVDDGVRLWVDDILLIDQWRESPITTHTKVLRQLGAGVHQIRVEYFQALGGSTAVVWWERANEFPQWKAEYFSDIHLAGAPLLVRNDPKIDFNWGLGSPAAQVPADNFSVRWTRHMFFEGGHYAFHARTSDGVRIYLDGLKVLDEWHDASDYVTYSGIFYELSRGTHTITVEYYERGGIAYAMVWWNPLGGGPIPQ
jgi:hypothetical protein